MSGALAEENTVSIIFVDAWADGPDAIGQWRGCWRLLRDGLAIRGRFGVTSERFCSEDLAICAGLACGSSDKRNVLDAESYRLY